MKYFHVVTNVAVTYKFSCWGRGRETAWRCLQNLQVLKNCFARLQIFVPAYKFLTCSRVVNRGCVPAPQVWCLQVLSLLTNFQTLYTVRHGPTHCTFFYFFFDYYYRCTKELIPEGTSHRQRVLPFCHVDLRMK